MERAEREAIMRQGVVRPETPRDRRERVALEDELRTISFSGRPLPVRARHFRPSADTYLLATRGPLAYMVRLREIEQRREEHESLLREAWREIAEACGDDDARFRREWVAAARKLSFQEVNDLIDRHNRWYPVEARLAMSPRTGDFVPVGGKPYRIEPLDSAWALEQIPGRNRRTAA
jgi:hypothetical protein